MQMLLNNRYRVIQTLGSGGFGETFLAEDTQMPSNRRCVVKLLRPIQNNPQVYQLVQERFKREAATLEELGGSTDQIPTLYAYFQSQGQFYLVQEWIEGDTLTAKMQSGLFTEDAVIELLVNILPVLEYIHNRRIVHRDIKPDNIILRYRDGKPVLIDFGAVREAMGTVIGTNGNSTNSIIIGTPGFMPSEQAAGRPLYSSDLYSLGLTAIYLLTGKQPQELETDPRNGEIVWYRYAANISPTLKSILDKAIAYHPRDRFATATEMLDALQRSAVTVNPTIPYSPPGENAQNTVPIIISHHIPSQPSSNKGILLIGLIAVSLVGAALAFGLGLFNRPSEKVTQITPEPTTPSNQVTKTPVEPQETPTPRQTIRPRTPPIVQRTPEPVETEDTIPVPIKTPSTEIPTISPTVIPTPTPIEPTPLPTPSPTTPPQVDRISPEKFVENYYTTINSGEFESAWNQLSPSFQSNKSIHPKGYLSYIDWWGGTVQQIEIEQVSLQKVGSQAATVDAQLTYLLKNGKQSSASVRFSLVWDATSNRWLVGDAQRIRG
jgi:serine/threonine-protein kinase